MLYKQNGLRRQIRIELIAFNIESSSVALPFQGAKADVVEIPEGSVVAEGS